MPHLLIIGAGIGGLATAASLRARGISSTLYERASQLREVGAALGLWPNATRVFHRLGILDDLLKTSHVPSVGALRSKSGRILKKMVQLEMEVPSVFAHRADVHRVLLQAIDPASLHLNKACTGIQHHETQLRAVFSDGTHSDWADGLIGADGIRSVVRSLTLRDGMPLYRGYVAWRGVATFNSPEEIVGETWGRGQRFGFIPLGKGRVGWWATANKPGEQGPHTCALPPEDWKKELLSRFADWHAPIPQLLEKTPTAVLLCNAIMDRAPSHPSKPWGKGPMTLLGDAAHATTPNLGQGACMAIEDAAVLAHVVAAIPDLPVAFRVYEQTRYARTAMIVRESLKFGKIGQWQNPVVCALRNALLHLAPDSQLRRQFRDLWTYDAWETPLILPP